jgi:hypothetical protein
VRELLTVWLLAILCLQPSFAQGRPATCNPDAGLELQIYKSRYDDFKVAHEICQRELDVSKDPRVLAEQQYTVRYYTQEAEVRDAEVAAYRWQLTAANWILGLVYLLTTAGLVFCGYQLWRSSRLSKLPPNLVEIELSVSKLKLQTSLIGIAVLVVSYAFLLVFTREIYQIRMVEGAKTSAPSVATAAASQSATVTIGAGKR